jgi:catecholate siderophore receptor
MSKNKKISVPSRPAFRRARASLAVQLALLALAASALPANADEGEAGAPVQRVTITGTAERGYDVKASSTATRTDTLLRDTPQAITVVSRELIRDQAMQGMADVIRYVPGVVTAQGEGNRDTAVFRGNSSTGDFFIDGIRDDVQYYRDLYNIDSVEALKGPNAMIFGRGGSGGVINRVSKQPAWTPVREVAATVGSWANRRVTADVGQPIRHRRVPGQRDGRGFQQLPRQRRNAPPWDQPDLRVQAWPRYQPGVRLRALSRRTDRRPRRSGL